MKLLAITCLTGSEYLVTMAERMLESLRRCAPAGVEMRLSCVSQGAFRPVHCSLLDFEVVQDQNQGFAYGMNTAIQAALDDPDRFVPDFVLCLNTDLEFPDPDWLDILLKAAPASRVTVPATDRTAIYTQPKAKKKQPFDIQEMSAYCWLVPFAWCRFLKQDHGWWLFDPEFFAFGEDNKTAYLLSKSYGAHVFRVVPRSFVKHLRHQTTSVIKHDRRESSRRLKEFFQDELKKEDLRPDLRNWAKRYVRKLKT